MKNITVSIDAELHRRARIRAAEKDTSISAVVRDFLIQFARGETEFERKKRLQDEVIAGISNFSGGNRSLREDLHDRRS